MRPSDATALEAGGRLRGDPGAPLTSAVPPVYCCCCLANASPAWHRGTVPESKPSFLLRSNVADIESLGVEVSYGPVSTGPVHPRHPAPPSRGPGSLKGRPAGSPLLNPGWAPAGTTEKIFEEKRELYDAYVPPERERRIHGHLQPLLKINSADREKYWRHEQR